MTSISKVNIGLIGFGNWGRKYFETLENIPKANLKYIYTNNKKNFLNNPNLIFTNDYDDIFSDPDINAVIIVTPQETHYKIAKKALLAGKNILLEKPMSSTTKECLDLINIAKKMSKTITVGHIYIHNPSIISIKKTIKEGKIGQIKYIYAERTGISKNMTSTGAMWELAPHDIYIINYLLNDSPFVKYAEGSYTDNVCDNVYISLNYQRNINVSIRVSRIDPNKSRKMIIVGTCGSIVFDELREDKIKRFNKEGILQPYKNEKNHQTPLFLQCISFINSIENTLKPIVTGEDGSENVRVLEKIQKHMEESKIIN